VADVPSQFSERVNYISAQGCRRALPSSMNTAQQRRRPDARKRSGSARKLIRGAGHGERWTA